MNTSRRSGCSRRCSTRTAPVAWMAAPYVSKPTASKPRRARRSSRPRRTSATDVENVSRHGSAWPGTSRSPTTRRKRLRLNHWGLVGSWNVGAESAALEAAGGRIVFRFQGRDLHLVLAPGKDGRPIRFKVSVDGAAPGDAHGVDTSTDGSGEVREPRLYQLVRQRGRIEDRTLRSSSSTWASALSSSRSASTWHVARHALSRQAESRGHPHQVGQGLGLHLPHHLASVGLHGDFADAELGADLLVQPAGRPPAP